jgi:transcriptional regulator with XRE-family HTH domain
LEATLDTTPAGFGKWLRARAAEAGFDPDVRGSLSALATAAGTDLGQTSRALQGKIIPSVETLRAFAGPLGTEMTEMLIRSGRLEPDDLPRGTVVISETADVAAIAEQYGVPAEQRDLFGRLVEAVAQQLATTPNPTGE